MERDTYADATLLLVGHGSTVNAASAAPVYAHTESLRQRRLFAGVEPCFWLQEPRLAAVRRSVRTARLFVVPLFLSEGYFTQEILPRELGLATAAPGGVHRPHQADAQRLYYCRPVGTHPDMTAVVLARASAVVRQHPFPRPPQPSETTLFLAGHGTERHEKSRQAVEHHAAWLRERTDYADVQGVFLEESPRVNECWQLAATQSIVVVPFFLSDGLHANEDIPTLLGEPEAVVRARLASGQPTWRNPTERGGKRLWYASGVGLDPLVVAVILARVRESAAGA